MIECKNCKGKGHVLDSNPFMFFNPFLLIVAAVERNDKDGSTRNKCSHCKGKGYITIK